MKSYPRLVSDIGGTNARFALESSPYIYEEIRVFERNFRKEGHYTEIL